MHSDNCKPSRNQCLHRKARKRSKRSKIPNFAFDPSPLFILILPGSPNRAVFDSDKGNPCHVQMQSPNTNIVHPEVWQGSDRCWRISSRLSHFEAANAQGRVHRVCQAESRRSPAEPRLFLAAICPLRTACQTAGVRVPPP